MIKDNKFTTDFEKILFSIQLDVHDGGIKFNINVQEEKDNPTFHEIIGALEYMKMHIVRCQQEGNKEIITKLKTDKKEPEDEKK